MSNKRVGAKGIAVWDERRNSSRVFPVSEQDVTNARAALHRLRITDPTLVEWIEAGHPTLTDAQHVEQFGERPTPPDAIGPPRARRWTTGIL